MCEAWPKAFWPNIVPRNTMHSSLAIDPIFEVDYWQSHTHSLLINFLIIQQSLSFLFCQHMYFLTISLMFSCIYRLIHGNYRIKKIWELLTFGSLVALDYSYKQSTSREPARLIFLKNCKSCLDWFTPTSGCILLLDLRIQCNFSPHVRSMP